MKVLAAIALAKVFASWPLGAEVLTRAIKCSDGDLRWISTKSRDHWRESILLLRDVACYLPMLDAEEVKMMRLAAEQCAFCIAEES